MKKKIALITGITGQDGSYLTELLLTKNYKIHGFVRKKFNSNKWKTNSLKKKITLHKVDFNNQKEIEKKNIVNRLQKPKYLIYRPAIMTSCK